jgi:hypothetical protein
MTFLLRFAESIKLDIMKNRVLLLIIILTSSVAMSGQPIELAPFGGYMFGGKVKFIQGEVNFRDNANFGIALNVPVERIASVEVFWSHMDTRAEWRPYTQYKPEYEPADYDVSIDYFQIGGSKQADLGTGIVKGFGSLTVGAAYFNIKDPDINDVWRFAATLGGGIKIFPTDRIGIRLQGRLLMPMYWGSAGFYAGIGTGGISTGVGVSTYTLLAQGDLTAGLVILIGE